MLSKSFQRNFLKLIYNLPKQLNHRQPVWSTRTVKPEIRTGLFYHTAILQYTSTTNHIAAQQITDKCLFTSASHKENRNQEGEMAHEQKHLAEVLHTNMKTHTVKVVLGHCSEPDFQQSYEQLLFVFGDNFWYLFLDVNQGTMSRLFLYSGLLSYINIQFKPILLNYFIRLPGDGKSVLTVMIPKMNLGMNG